jgi:hypothetical protein
MPGQSEHCRECETVAELLREKPNCDGCPWLMHGVIPVLMEVKP